MGLSKTTIMKPSESEPQRSSEIQENLKEKAYSFISDSIQEFQKDLNLTRIESLLSPFENLKGKQ